MSRVKDLMHAILKEDFEEEEEIVEEVAQPVKVEKAPVEVQPTFVQPKIKPVSEDAMIASFITEPKKQQEVKKPSIFDGMNAEDIASATPIRRNKKSGYKYDRSKLSKTRRLQEDLEYTPIISPIFGNTQEEKKEFDKIHNAIDLQKPDEDFGFTTIISPMFGNSIPTPKPVEEIPVKKPVVEKQEKKSSELTLKDMLATPAKEETKQQTLFDKE